MSFRLGRWAKPAAAFARRPSWLLGLVIVVAFVGVALLAPFTTLPRPENMFAAQYLPPSADHWMGTDNFGRDVFSRVVWGTRLALQVAIISSALATMVGILLGSLSGYFGGWIDAAMSRAFDAFLLIPAFFLVLVIVALFGSSIYLIMIAIAATDWPRAARIMRAQVLTLKSRTFVQASLGAGASHLQVLFRHVIPNGLPPIVTNATLLMGLAILTEAGLSFLGLGDQNTTSWGRMIFEGQRQLRLAPWMSVFPGAAMLLLVGALNLVGDGLNQVLNPQLRAPERKSPPPRVAAAAAASILPDIGGERPLLQVTDLRMYYRLAEGWVRAVDGVSFAVPRGGSLGIVGESGCGKSSLGLTLMQVLPPNARVLGGQVMFDGQSMLDRGGAAFAEVRWKRQAMIFQSAMNALNPVLTVRQQLREAYRFHKPAATRAEAHARIEELFDLVGIPRWRMSAYPHELSGGMRQRVMIALGLLHNPDLIIADEPTTALDVLIQDQIMGEIDDLRRRLNLSLILISHDMGMVAETCERVAVMYAGELVEQAPTDVIFARPRHPYTRALIGSLPRLTGPKRQLTSLPGEPYVPIGDPVGCRFAARCAMATDLCRREAPPGLTVEAGHLAACHYALDGMAAPRPVQARVG